MTGAYLPPNEEAEEVLKVLMADGTFDELRGEIVNNLKANGSLREYVEREVASSAVLTGADASRKSRKKLFGELRAELEDRILERVLKLAWEAMAPGSSSCGGGGGGSGAPCTANTQGPATAAAAAGGSGVASRGGSTAGRAQDTAATTAEPVVLPRLLEQRAHEALCRVHERFALNQVYTQQQQQQHQHQQQWTR